MKIRPMGPEMFHADGRTDGQKDRHEETNGRFSQFCERAKNLHLITQSVIFFVIFSQ